MSGLLLVGLAAAPVAAQSGDSVRLSLAQALALADSASPAVGMARAGVTSAEAAYLRARADYLPQISGSVLYTRTLASEFSGFASNNSPDSFPSPVNCHHFLPNPTLPVADRLDSLEHALDCTANGSGLDFSDLPFGRPNTWTFGLSGAQTIFNATLPGQLHAADAGRDQAAIELDAQRAAAVLGVAEAYLDAQLAERLVEIADSALVQAQRTYEQTRLERQVGNAAEFDELRASVVRNNLRPVLIQRQAIRHHAMLHLHQVLDLPAATELVLTTAIDDTTSVGLPPFAARLASTPDAAVDTRAPVRQARAAVDASKALLGSARAERLPSLTLSSTYARIAFPENVFSFDRFVTDWSVSAQVSIPVFSGGRLQADALAAEARDQQARWQLRQAQHQAQLEQGDAVTDLQSAIAAVTAGAGTVAEAQRAYAIAELRYRNGLSTLVELGDARVQLGQAEANYAQASHDMQMARLRLALLHALPFGTGIGSNSAFAGTSGSQRPQPGGATAGGNASTTPSGVSGRAPGSNPLATTSPANRRP